MKTQILLVLFLLVLVQLACGLPSAPASNPNQTLTNPLPTQAAQPTLASEPSTTTAGLTSPAVPAGSSQQIVLGSPFSTSCGDGKPLIWRNASFNDQLPFDYAAEADDRHGYVTFYPPKGCDISNTDGEVVAPADGELKELPEYGVIVTLPDKVYPAGMEEALKFIGIQNGDLARISNIQLQFGKYLLANGASGPVKKGQSIGDIAIPSDEPPQLEYQVIFNYDNGEGVNSYIVSPTLFQYDGKPWPCAEGSPFDCEPKAKNFK